MKIAAVAPLNDGITESAARSLWDGVERFAAYSFNKSHSVAYTLISWQTMWLKTYHPAAFYAAAMSVVTDEDQLANLMSDAKNHGIEILPPDLNVSSSRIEIGSDRVLYAPFQAVKGISSNTADALVKLRTAAGGRYTVDEKGEIAQLGADYQKAVLGKKVITSRSVESLDRIGAFYTVDGKGAPPTSQERIKARLELMPGFTIDMVKPKRDLELAEASRLKVISLVRETRTCAGCSLSGRSHPMPRHGKAPKFMMVFDTPTWQEEKSGRMLEGNNLDAVKAALGDIGMTVEDGYYTSLVKSAKPKDQKMLTNEQINGCSGFLQREIEILQPPVIIAMGSNSIRYFSPGTKGSPSELAGRVIYNEKIDASIVMGMNLGSLFHDPSKISLVEKIFTSIQRLFEKDRT